MSVNYLGWLDFNLCRVPVVFRPSLSGVVFSVLGSGLKNYIFSANLKFLILLAK